MHLLLTSTTCSDLCRMTKISEDEMKWLDMCFKMAVSANQVIPDLVISRLETKKTVRWWNSIMAGISSQTLDTVLVLSSLSAASISTISAVSSLSHSQAILLNCFYSILLRNSTKEPARPSRLFEQYL